MANFIDKWIEYRDERKKIKEALKLENPNFW